MEDKDLNTSAVSRLFKLGGLVSRVGASMAGNTVANAFRAKESREDKKLESLVKNAAKMVETLGNLKGVPMKVGQMLSLHEGFLPPEVTKILSSLQQKAPSVPFSSILEMIQEELGDNFVLVEGIDPEPYASASIGQVHRGLLTDGRDVVFKVQYPGIDKVIRADMKNLKGMLKMIFSMFTKMDLDKIWDELNDRLLEELDYENESANMIMMAKIHKDSSSILVPKPVKEASGPHVLCMELLQGIEPGDACSEKYPQELKDKWGIALFELLVNGILVDKFLHADPNIANFSFLEDGRVIVYDYGCMKKIPDFISEGYARLADAVLNDRLGDIPLFLYKMGAHKADGDTVAMNMIEDYAKIVKLPFDREQPFTFGPESNLYEKFFEQGKAHFHDGMNMVFPQDIVFIDRSVIGHFGNLNKLNATGQWGEIVEPAIEKRLKKVREMDEFLLSKAGQTKINQAKKDKK